MTTMTADSRVQPLRALGRLTVHPYPLARQTIPPFPSPFDRGDARPRLVALAFPTSPAHLHLIARGIADFAAAHGHWLLTTHGEAPTLPIEDLRGWNGDGIIASLDSPAEDRVARRLVSGGIPVVTFSGALPRPSVPRVQVDNAAIGRAAAEHLLQQGYEQFGFYGLEGVDYSEGRCAAFLQRLSDAGRPCVTHLSPYQPRSSRPRQSEMQSLVEWARGLSRPTGVFAVNDYRAALLTDACRLGGLRVPSQVGVVGADNNHVLCEENAPALSSVDCNWYGVGYQAAAVLNRLMNSSEPAPADVTVDPIGVVSRASTEYRVLADGRLALAVAYAREHLAEPFGVERLISMCGTSRRTLELAFQRELGCSPYQFLSRERVARAKRLLRETRTLPLEEVARRCGFRDLKRFREVFRRVEGLTPAAYRDLAEFHFARETPHD